MDAVGLVKDIVELGFAIKESLDKVGNNSKRSRQLIDEIIETLDDLKTVYDNDERVFAGAVHLHEASARLQQNLESVHSLCRNLVPERKRGKLLVKAKATFVAWKNRDDIEGELLRLKEHVFDCLAKFTAFSTGRTENAVARTEHALILHSAEVRFKFSHLDVLVGKMLVDSPWGERAGKSIEINISDHGSIERQYLKLQAHSLVERMNAFVAALSPLQVEQPNSKHRAPLIPVFHVPEPSCAVVHAIWSLRCSIEDTAHVPSMQDTADRLDHLGECLTYYNLHSEAMQAYQGASLIYHWMSQQHPDFLPYMVRSDLNFADNCIDQASVAIPMIRRAMAALDSYEAQTAADAHVLRAWALCNEGSVLLNGKDFEGASHIFATSLSLSSDIIRNIPLKFPDASPAAVDQLAVIFADASNACCGYVECMVELGRLQEAVSTIMKGLSHYQHLPSWAIDICNKGMSNQQEMMSASLTKTIIKLYVDGQLSIAFLHELVEQLLPLAVMRPRQLSSMLWDISAIYASLSATHLTVPYHGIIPIPVSPTFSLLDAHGALLMRLPYRLAELLAGFDMDVLFHDYFTSPYLWYVNDIAPLMGQIISVEYIKKHAEMLKECETTTFLVRLYLILGTYTPEEHRLPISAVTNMLFRRIPHKERYHKGEFYARILFRLGMYTSALDVIKEYVSTPLLPLLTQSMQIICLLKLGRIPDAISFAQPFILEFWSRILSLQDTASSPWQSICQKTLDYAETMTAMKMSWMLSAGYYEDVTVVKLYETSFCSLKCTIDELREFALTQRRSHVECTPLIPRELWDIFRSRFPETDPATLLFGSQTSLTHNPSSVPPNYKLSPADPVPTSKCESDPNEKPSHQPTDSTSAPPVAQPEGTHATQTKDSPAIRVSTPNLVPAGRQQVVRLLMWKTEGLKPIRLSLSLRESVDELTLEDYESELQEKGIEELTKLEYFDLDRNWSAVEWYIPIRIPYIVDRGTTLLFRREGLCDAEMPGLAQAYKLV